MTTQHEPVGTQQGADGHAFGAHHGPPPGTVRVRLDLGYDGTDFVGWAAQRDLRSVEGELTAALERVARVPAGTLGVTVAGRTDAGVHARGQVAHVDVPVPGWEALPGRSDRTPAHALVVRLAGVLPPDVRVRRAEVAPPGFDARFSALERRYRYRIADTEWGTDPLRRRDVLWVDRGLDLEAMDAAARRLTGLNDFAAYCKRREGATTIRTLLEYRWDRDEGGLAVATVRADAFCHSMVRALVGAAIAVGAGRRGTDWPEHVLRQGTRDPGVSVAQAHGLTLEEVVYPAPDQLAARARLARRTRSADELAAPEG